MGLALVRKSGHAGFGKSQKTRAAPTEAEALESNDLSAALPELSMAALLRCRVRYFTDGAVIGSRIFVNELFFAARDRFPERRKDGARRMRGNASPAVGILWSMRDLRLHIT